MTQVLLDPAIQIGADLAKWLEIGGGQGLAAIFERVDR